MIARDERARRVTPDESLRKLRWPQERKRLVPILLVGWGEWLFSLHGEHNKGCITERVKITSQNLSFGAS